MLQSLAVILLNRQLVSISKALEDELKCKFLIRNSHSITLTECGEVLFAQAKEILKLLDDCVEWINTLNNYILKNLRRSMIKKL